MAFALAQKSKRPARLQAKRGRTDKQAVPLGHVEQDYGVGSLGFTQSFSGAVPVVQAKLKIGEPDDKYEKEADRVADEVIRMPDPKATGASADTGVPGSSNQSGSSLAIQRMCTDCAMDEKDKLQRKSLSNKPVPPRILALNGAVTTRLSLSRQELVIQRQETEKDEEETLQMKSASSFSSLPTVTPSVEAGIHSLKGGGQPLLASTRAFFEPRFGLDFGGVRVHADENSAQVAQSIQAKAFTNGQNIVFGAGEYAPGSPGGNQLLAHELTHVVQQSRNLSQRSNPRTQATILGNIRRPSNTVNLASPSQISRALATGSSKKRVCLQLGKNALQILLGEKSKKFDNNNAFSSAQIRVIGSGFRDKFGSRCDCDCIQLRQYVKGVIIKNGADQVASSGTIHSASCGQPFALKPTAFTEETALFNCIPLDRQGRCEYVYTDYPGIGGSDSSGHPFLNLADDLLIILTFKWLVWDSCQNRGVRAKQATLRIIGEWPDSKPKWTDPVNVPPTTN